MDAAIALKAEHITKYFHEPVKFQVLSDIALPSAKGNSYQWSEIRLRQVHPALRSFNHGH